LRSKMRWQESVSGQDQLRHFINRSDVHKVLSEIYEQSGKLDLSVSHLSEAVSAAEYRDKEADYLLLLGELLERIERFRDAQAVLKMLRSRRFTLEPQTFSITKTRQLEILSCILNTRTRQYDVSIDMGKHLRYTWTTTERYDPLSGLGSKSPEPSSNLNNTYQRRLADPPLIFFYSKFISFINGNPEKAEKGQYEPLTSKSPSVAVDGNSLLYHWFWTDDTKQMQAFLAGDPGLVCFLAERYLNLEMFALLILDLYKTPFVVDHPSEVAAFLGKGEVDELRKTKPSLSISWTINVRMADFLCRESLRILEQMCHLTNNFVFNRVELGIDAVSEMALLKRAVPAQSSNAQEIDAVIKLMKILMRFADAYAPEHTAAYRRYLVNYYDTWAWLLYRDLEQEAHATYPAKIVEKLEKARDMLVGNALIFDQGSAIIYYHLARIYLALAEQFWLSGKHWEITSSLRLADRNWRKASELDVNGRLQSRLNWVGQRIERLSNKLFDVLDSKLDFKTAPGNRPYYAKTPSTGG
jgi:hypothetical protein